MVHRLCCLHPLQIHSKTEGTYRDCLSPYQPRLPACFQHLTEQHSCDSECVRESNCHPRICDSPLGSLSVSSLLGIRQMGMACTPLESVPQWSPVCHFPFYPASPWPPQLLRCCLCRHQMVEITVGSWSRPASLTTLHILQSSQSAFPSVFPGPQLGCVLP